MSTTWQAKLKSVTPDKPAAAPASLPEPVLPPVSPPPPKIRVIVREGRAARTEPVQQLALRLPQSLVERLDLVIAGQRHGAILKLLSWSLDELERQDKILDK